VPGLDHEEKRVKRKQKQIEERRRALLEFNLIGEPKPRSIKTARRGCGIFGAGGILAVLLAAVAAAYLGLY
jgi:hypothetical protein